MAAEEPTQEAAHINPPSTQASGITSSFSQVKSNEEILTLTKETAAGVAKEAARSAIEKGLPRYTEILGVFVALFTFVSIQIQIFSRVTSLANAVLFSFLIFLCMVGFLFTLHLVINMKGESLNGSKWALIGLMFVIGVGLFSISYLLKNDVPLSIQEDNRINNMEKDIEFLKGLIKQP